MVKKLAHGDHRQHRAGQRGDQRVFVRRQNDRSVAEQIGVRVDGKLQRPEAVSVGGQCLFTGNGRNDNDPQRENDQDAENDQQHVEEHVHALGDLVPGHAVLGGFLFGFHQPFRVVNRRHSGFLLSIRTAPCRADAVSRSSWSAKSARSRPRTGRRRRRRHSRRNSADCPS